LGSRQIRRNLPTIPEPTEAFTRAVQTQVPMVDAQGRLIREAPTPERQYSLPERIAGGAEAAESVLRGIVGFPIALGQAAYEGIREGDASPGGIENRMSAILENMGYAPRTEAGQEYTENIGKFFERLETEYKVPAIGAAPSAVPLLGVRGVPAQVGRAVSEELATPPIGAIGPINEARTLSKTDTLRDSEGLYETGREGPFLTVINRGVEPSQQTAGGFRLYGGTAIDARDPGKRSALYGDAPGQAEQEVQLRLAPENNPALRIAQDFTRKNIGSDYNFDFKIEPSSLKKQSAVGISYELAANKLPGYSDSVFTAYKNDPEYGSLIEQRGIKNYDDLVRESYKQLEKETIEQFRQLPVKMSFHKKGEGNYLDSNEMVKDAHLHNHLFVYQGGDPHEFLGKVDKSTGLSSNDMFRAVHDYFGHAIKGNSFGPKGEEIAWASHAQMYSPLARIAMTAETRGQNSFVNYTPINADLVMSMEKLRKAEIDLRRSGNEQAAEQVKNQIRELGGQWQYAKQASVALPPEMTKIDYAGGMPEYVRKLQRPGGEELPAEHWSRVAEMKVTDPSKQGTAAAGKEKTRLQYPGAIRGRTYFYAEGREPEQVVRSIAPYKYKSTVSSLYNADKDPLGIKKLANVKNTESYLSKINKGSFDADSATNDFERMVYERGFVGFVTGSGKNRVAVAFEPIPVEPQ
jgi:hypothetical protein